MGKQKKGKTLQERKLKNADKLKVEQEGKEKENGKMLLVEERG